MDASALSYYTSQGPVTDPGESASLFDKLPTGSAALRDTLQGVMLHIFGPSAWAGRSPQAQGRGESARRGAEAGPCFERVSTRRTC